MSPELLDQVLGIVYCGSSTVGLTETPHRSMGCFQILYPLVKMSGPLPSSLALDLDVGFEVGRWKSCWYLLSSLWWSLDFSLS